MFHRIRESMKDEDGATFSGVVEADETFVGGKTKATFFNASGQRKLAHGPATGKTTVFGMMQRATPERGSRVRAMVVPDHKRASLLPHIRKNIAAGSMLYTDALRSYRGLEPEYLHAFVDHMVTYVEGAVHTNTIENFWSCLKRTVKGTYICPRPFHMDAYVDEQVFRFNAREGNDSQRFVSVLKNTDGRRLTRKALITSNPSLRIGQRGPIHRVQAQ